MEERGSYEPLLPNAGVNPIRPLNQSPYVFIEAVSLPLACFEAVPLSLVHILNSKVFVLCVGFFATFHISLILV